MTHLDHDELVLHYYGEPHLGEDRRAHLQTCEACRNELASLASVLDRVTPIEVPEPADDYEARVWDRLQWRLRGEKRTNRRTWMAWAAVAAIVAVAFVAGLLFRRPATVTPSTTVVQNQPATTNTPAKAADNSTRVLLVVVGEHLDDSERVLTELTNLTANGTTDITTARDRAQELLASNRLYRTTATTRGEGDVATLLDELEPVLLQIAHAPTQCSAEELRSIQKRVESKGLVFKLRVVRADVDRGARTSPSTSI